MSSKIFKTLHHVCVLHLCLMNLPDSQGFTWCLTKQWISSSQRGRGTISTCFTLLTSETFRMDFNIIIYVWRGCKTWLKQSRVHVTYFFNSISPAMRHGKTPHPHSDSCAEQSKNTILLGYLTTRVRLGYDSIDWQFMTVGLTKFRPEEAFGQIRRDVSRWVDVFSLEELSTAINNSSVFNRCVQFSNINL